jgi:DNA-binding NtrC family response regulator
MSVFQSDAKAASTAAQINSSPSGGSLRARVREATRRLEAEIILEALEQHRWNRRRTAEALGISYRMLMYKMREGDLRAIPPDRPNVT